jgi:cob(I)alamin adenosyltransferase
MPKLTRIYTRTGDDGTTGLVGGQRVKKNALRSRPVQDVARANAVALRLDAWLAWTQDVLFNVGSDLATLPQDRWPGMPLAAQTDVTALERAIDEAQTDLPPLANFIHPGGSYAGAFLHQARTVCRRAERLLTTLVDNEPISADVVHYVNRLSDALFVWSRWINHHLEQPEHLWNPETAPPAPR